MSGGSLHPNPVNCVTVDSKGGADFRTIQGAIDSITNASSTNRFVIQICPGTYVENVVNKNFISLVGQGSGPDVTVLSFGGTVLTTPDTESFYAFIGFVSLPSASGFVCVDLTAGGTHTFFFAGAFATSSTAGINGNLYKLASDTLLIAAEGINRYLLSGSSVGTVTHDIMDIQGSASVRFFRSDLIATVADVDDNYNLVNDNSTGLTEFVSGEWQINQTNASWSGIGNVFKFGKKTTTNKLLVNSLSRSEGAGSGTINYIKMDTDTDDGLVQSNSNTVEIKGFTNNKFADVATGDLIQSSNDLKTVDDDPSTGVGMVDFMNDSANGSVNTAAAFTQTIDVTDEWHAVDQLVAGVNSDNVEIKLGTSAAFTAVADGGSGEITVTSAGHSLLAGEYISITGSNTYDDIYVIESVTTNTFNVTATFVATSTGTFSRGTRLKNFERGFYEFNWSFSADSAGNNLNYQFTVFDNAVEITETRRETKFASAGDVDTVAGGGQFFVEKDSHIWFAVKNVSNATDIDLNQGSVYISKIS